MEDTHSTTNKRKKTTSKLIKISIIFFFLLIIVGITVSILLVFIILPSPETTPAPIANTTIPVTTPRTTQPKITTVAPLVNFCLTYQTVDSNIASWARSVCKVQVEVKLLGPQPVQRYKLKPKRTLLFDITQRTQSLNKITKHCLYRGSPWKYGVSYFNLSVRRV
jgi:flagellar basal body-associated protein FliL